MSRRCHVVWAWRVDGLDPGHPSRNGRPGLTWRAVTTTIRRDLRSLALVAVVSASIVGIVAAVRGSNGSSASAGSAPASSSVSEVVEVPAAAGGVTSITVAGPGVSSTTVAAAAATDDHELDGSESGGTGDGCTIEVASIRLGASGESVTCVQQALTREGLYTGAISGQFDDATYRAVRGLQEQRKMFVDGIVGRETAISLDVWPDEASLVIRTPAPAPGAKDLLGFKLSPVATSGPDAPPLPDGSGSGKRLVYDRAGQRVWAVDANERVIRSWLVSGSKYSNEVPGTHRVYSKSERSTAWNGQAYLPMMVRYYRTKIGAIGFHGIPTHVSDGSVYQTDAELGTRLSGGCQRQNNLDATFVWNFAEIGTTVVVV